MTQHQIEGLQNWWQENNITVHPHVALHNFPLMGYGFIATSPIQSGEIVLSAPKSCHLAYSTSEFKTLETMGLENLDSMQYPNTLLALSLLHEMRKPDSFYQNYIALLPTSDTSSLPMFWSETELAELENTNLEATLNLEKIEKDFRKKIQPITDNWDSSSSNKSTKKPSTSTSTSTTLNMYKTALAIILSRAFQAEDGSPYLCPVVDMLNADINSCNIQVGSKGGYLLAKASRDIRQGDQIMNTYGAFSNAELLRKYGYIEAVNPNDEVHIDMDLVCEVCSELFGELPEERSAFMELDTLVLSRDPTATNNSTATTASSTATTSLPTTTFITDVGRVASLHAMDDEDFTTLQELAQEDGMDGAWNRFIEESGGMPEAQVRGVALLVLGRKLSGYPTTAEDDQAWLEQHMDEFSRKRMAVELRLSEKTIISAWMSLVKGSTPQSSKKSKGKGKPSDQSGKKRKY